MDNYKEEIDRLIEVCHALHSSGMVSGSGGNVSIRTGDSFWITATGVSLRDTSRENLVHLFSDGSFEGINKPSKEYLLHLLCYTNRNDIKAVVHVHSLYSVALSCLKKPGDSIPVYFPGYAMRVGDLPLVPYYKPGRKELAESVGNVISDRNSVMLCNHGIVTVGRDMSQALNIMEEIEENAHLFFILNGQGNSLSRGQVNEIQGIW